MQLEVEQMNKILKIISTLLIGIGLVYIFLYVTNTGSTGIEILQKPSYYTRQNFWYIFLAGAMVLVFSMLSGFFIWHKDAQPKDEILLNAGFAGKKQITGWLAGSTLDMTANTVSKEQTITEANGKTEILSQDKTEILEEGETEVLSEEEKTEILEEGTGTEILTEEELT